MSQKIIVYHYTNASRVRRIENEGLIPKSNIVPYNDSRIPSYPRTHKGVFLSLDLNFNGHLQGLLEHVVSKNFNPEIAIVTLQIPIGGFVLDSKYILDANSRIYDLREDFRRSFSLNPKILGEYFGLRKKVRDLKVEGYIGYWNSRMTLENYLSSQRGFVIPEVVVLDSIPNSSIVSVDTFDFREYFPESGLNKYLV